MLKDLVVKAKNYLFVRQQSYQAIFLGSPIGEVVLSDLAKFCRADHTTFHPDERIHAALEGRREVWLRIQHHLKLNQDELWKLYGRKDLEP